MNKDNQIANVKAEIQKCIDVFDSSSNQNATMLKMGLEIALSIINKFMNKED